MEFHPRLAALRKLFGGHVGRRDDVYNRRKF